MNASRPGAYGFVSADDDALARAFDASVRRHDLFLATGDRVRHFIRRAAELGMPPSEVVIVVLDVDDPMGGVLAGHLLPSVDWQQYRDRGETPVARGLITRDAMQNVVAELSAMSARRLADMEGLAVVVIAHGGVSVFAAEEAGR